VRRPCGYGCPRPGCFGSLAGPNVLATRLAVAVYGSWSVIVGPCVVTGDFEGATVSLPGPWGDWIIDCPVAGFLVTVGSRLG